MAERSLKSQQPQKLQIFSLRYAIPRQLQVQFPQFVTIAKEGNIFQIQLVLIIDGQVEG